MIRQIGTCTEWTKDGRIIITILWSDDEFLGDKK